MKNIRIAFFASTMLLLLWFPFNMIWHTRYILKNGTPYRFSLQPIDPHDVFRGSYVTLNYTIPLIPVADSLFRYQEVYVTIREDSAGFHSFDKIYLQAPKTEVYLKTKVNYYTDGKVQIEAPENMRYFYLNEKAAPAVENVMNRLAPTDSVQNRAHVQVRVRKGEAVVEELYINGLAVKDFLERQ